MYNTIESILMAMSNELDQETHWQFMLVLADAIEDEGGDSRGWRWLSKHKKYPCEWEHIGIFWVPDNARGEYVECSCPYPMSCHLDTELFYTKSRCLKYAPFSTILDAEKAAANAIVEFLNTQMGVTYRES